MCMKPDHAVHRNLNSGYVSVSSVLELIFFTDGVIFILKSYSNVIWLFLILKNILQW